MPKPWLAAFLFFVATPFAGAARAPEKTPPSKPDYSQEAAVVEQVAVKVKFENDGTSSQENSATIRVQSEAGVQSYGLLTFSYASGIGTFDIDYIRVLKPDGSLILTPLDSVQDMPSEITRQAPFYSDLREKHAAVKGLSIGDVLEYKTTSHLTKPLAPGQFWLDYNFSHDAILLHEELEVSAPRDRAIKWKSPDSQPTITDAGPSRVYVWTNSHLVREPKNDQLDNAKALYEQGRGRFPSPDVQLTTFQSWDEMGRWYRALQADRVKPTPEIIAKANELTKGAPNDDAKLRAIYDFVSMRFRYIGVAFGIGRYQPHPAAEVLANQYGDCKDKHTLLAALLGAAGFKAYPALISTQHELDPDLPSPSQFNHVITAVPRGSDLLWLDTTTEVGPFQYLIGPLRNKHALVLWDDKPASMAVTPADLPFPSTQDFQMAGTLDSDGTFSGTASFNARGDFEYLLRAAFRSTPMPQWKDLVQRLSMGLGFAGEVSEVTASSPEKTDEPFHLAYKYHRKDFGDWPNHRIVAPAPFVALPAMSSDMSSLSVPFWLGEPLEISSHSELELPKGYSLEVPAAIHLKRAFAEFDATYAMKDGKFISDRRLRTLLLDLPKSDFSEYEKFCKVIQDDYGSFIQLASGPRPAPGPATNEANVFMNSIRDLPDSPNQEALRLESEGRDAIGRQDFQAATSSLYRSVGLDPKFARAWLTLGELLMTSHQTDSGMDAFQKAIAAAPQEPAIYKMYGYSLDASSKFAEAVPIWQAYIKLTPEDPDGFGCLGLALIKLKRYEEAAQALASSLKIYPNSAEYQSHLAIAYLRAGMAEKAAPAYRQLLELHPPSAMLDQAAYDMADAPGTLPVALELAERSVRSLEEASTQIDLNNLSFDDEEHTRKLASYWGTLGVVQQRLGKLDAAEKTLNASWNLTQNGVAAAHLCELYLDQHKSAAALRMCRFARNRLPLEKDPTLYHVPDLISQNDARLEKLSPGSSKTYNIKTIDQVVAMRDFKLPRVFRGTTSAEFFVLLQFDSLTGKFKVQGVKYISGSEKLKSVSSSLTKLNFNFTSPDANPVHLVRRGTFLCGDPSGCEFMLPDANAGRPFSVVPIQRTN